MTSIWIAFAGAVLLSLVVTPLVSRLAHRAGRLDHPEGRKAHAQSTPRLGGIAIMVAWAVVLAASAAGAGGETLRASLHDVPVQAMLAGGLLVFAVGLRDDFSPLAPTTKVFGQVLAAATVAGAGVLIHRVTAFGVTYDLGQLAVVATIVWIVVITNAFNLIDGLDGLATGVAIIAGSSCTLIVLLRGDYGTAVVLAALLGGLVGFLPFNFNPASIFLGDGGALLTGFVLAVTAITGFQKGATALASGIPLLIFALPILDTAGAVIRRLRASRAGGGTGRFGLARVLQPDRAHIHHTLMDRGFSHRATVLLLYAVALAFAAAALLTMER